jgi:hypothetical protein
MAFNTKKCKVMHCGRQNQQAEYRMDGHVLERTEEERDIGVIVASNMKLAAQCARATKTA